MHATLTSLRRRTRLVPALVAAVVSLTAGCKERCYERQSPDGTADFSALRLHGRLLCSTSGNCSAAFSASTMQLTMLGETGNQDVLSYDVLYQGTHEQVKNVTVEPSGLGVCEKYRRETWAVPNVTMTLLSATRNGQPLTIGDSTTGPSPTFRELTVKLHYVDRTKSDEYVGVLVNGVQLDTGPWLEMPLTKTGRAFFFAPDNP